MKDLQQFCQSGFCCRSGKTSELAHTEQILLGRKFQSRKSFRGISYGQSAFIPHQCTGRNLRQSGKDGEQCAFAGTVPSDQCRCRSGLHKQGHFIQHRTASIKLRGPGKPNKRRSLALIAPLCTETCKGHSIIIPLTFFLHLIRRGCTNFLLR
ncbi:hypothetical protein D3C73_855300 [compost metagenome]